MKKLHIQANKNLLSHFKTKQKKNNLNKNSLHQKTTKQNCFHELLHFVASWTEIKGYQVTIKQ